jgi:hypothetical protein
MGGYQIMGPRGRTYSDPGGMGGYRVYGPPANLPGD